MTLDSDAFEFFQIFAKVMRLSDAEYEELIDSAADEDEPEERVSEYQLDPFWPGDEWLEAGEEWELAPDYGED